MISVHHMTSSQCIKLCKAHFAGRASSFLMHTWWQDNSDSRKQEQEGHALSSKTLRSHITRDYTVFNTLGQGQ